MQVQAYSRSAPPERGGGLGFPHIRLEQVTWDDYGYKSTFSVELVVSNDEKVELGGVKVALGKEGCRLSHLPAILQDLDPGIVSLGQSIAYYRRLGTRVSKGLRDDYLRTMGDALADAGKRSSIEGSGVWNKSLLREPAARHALARGGFYIGAPCDEVAPPRFDFEVHLPGALNAHLIGIDFSERSGIPSRTMLLIGPNGTGKTRTLASLATALLPKEVFEPSTIVGAARGSIVPQTVISRVIAVSYNAFDDFPLPVSNESIGLPAGVDYRSKESYKYCGMRNAAGKIDRDEITAMLDAALGPVAASDREEVLERVLTTLLGGRLAAALCGPQAARAATIQMLSAGQRLVAAIFCNIVGFIEEGSLLLVDEPETHLHPGLLTSVAAAFDDVLKEFDSYAIMATHSPILLQQVPSQFVRVFRRRDGASTVGTLDFESFGEDIGELSRNVLGLADPERDFTDVLRKLYSEQGSAEAVEGLFAHPLGIPARAYLYALEDVDTDPVSRAA